MLNPYLSGKHLKTQSESSFVFLQKAQDNIRFTCLWKPCEIWNSYISRFIRTIAPGTIFALGFAYYSR